MKPVPSSISAKRLRGTEIAAFGFGIPGSVVSNVSSIPPQSHQAEFVPHSQQGIINLPTVLRLKM